MSDALRRESGSDPLEVEIFYADPVDENGDKIGTATFKVTKTSGLRATVTKVPHDEIVLDENTLHIRPWEDEGNV